MRQVFTTLVPHFLMVLLLSISCNETDKSPLPNRTDAAPSRSAAREDSAASKSTANGTDSVEQISQYIRRMFQDRDGNIWFGTETDGVARYSGRSLDYFSPVEGFSGTSVRGMVQDVRGDLWFATRGGVSRFDGTQFTSWTTKDGLANDQVWCVLLDKSGGLWFGTEGGVSRFEPSTSLRPGSKTFTSFPLPAADLSGAPNVNQSPRLINAIIEDKAGNIWFGSNGNGAYKYDGRTLTNISKKDGLCDDFIQSMIEDRDGNLWFGTRFGGLCKYDPSVSRKPGKSAFITYTKEDGLTRELIWTLYEDGSGIIWIATAYAGLCSFDGASFTSYQQHEGLGNSSVHSVMEDAAGQLWVGTADGVYRFDGKRFFNWTKKNALAR